MTCGCVKAHSWGCEGRRTADPIHASRTLALHRTLRAAQMLWPPLRMCGRFSAHPGARSTARPRVSPHARAAPSQARSPARLPPPMTATPLPRSVTTSTSWSRRWRGATSTASYTETSRCVCGSRVHGRWCPAAKVLGSWSLVRWVVVMMCPVAAHPCDPGHRLALACHQPRTQGSTDTDLTGPTSTELKTKQRAVSQRCGHRHRCDSTPGTPPCEECAKVLLFFRVRCIQGQGVGTITRASATDDPPRYWPIKRSHCVMAPSHPSTAHQSL